MTASTSPGVCLVLGGSGVLGPDDPGGRCVRALARGLARRGLATVWAPKPRAAPDYHAEYVRPALALLRSYGADGAPVVVVGHSLGGHVAPLVAREVTSLAGVAMLNAALTDIDALLDLQLAVHARSASSEVRRFIERSAPELHDYLLRGRGYRPASYLAELDVPILCVAGTLDRVVAPAELDTWALALSSAGAVYEVRAYDGLDHFGCRVAGDGTRPPNRMELDSGLLDEIATWTHTVLRDEVNATA